MAENIVKGFGSKVEFASFGKNAIAYVRETTSDDLNERFPKVVELPDGLDLWALFGADGQPIAVGDERADVLENAEAMELLPLQLN